MAARVIARHNFQQTDQPRIKRIENDPGHGAPSGGIAVARERRVDVRVPVRPQVEPATRLISEDRETLRAERKTRTAVPTASAMVDPSRRCQCRRQFSAAATWLRNPFITDEFDAEG